MPPGAAGGPRAGWMASWPGRLRRSEFGVPSTQSMPCIPRKLVFDPPSAGRSDRTLRKGWLETYPTKTPKSEIFLRSLGETCGKCTGLQFVDGSSTAGASSPKGARRTLLPGETVENGERLGGHRFEENWSPPVRSTGRNGSTLDDRGSRRAGVGGGVMGWDAAGQAGWKPTPRRLFIVHCC